MEDKIISEKYLTEIAFTKRYDTTDDYYIMFWMADDYDNTIKRLFSKSLEDTVSIVGLNRHDKKQAIIKKLEEKPLNIFYAIDTFEDSREITMILVGTNPKTTDKMSIEINDKYENDAPSFFKFLRAEGLRIK
jgi:hypothetical protein